MEIIYGRTIFVRGLPKHWSNIRKRSLISNWFTRYGQLDTVQVFAHQSYSFVTFYKSSALRFVLRNKTTALHKVQGYHLECTKAYNLRKSSPSMLDGPDHDIFGNSIKMRGTGDIQSWMMQTPVPDSIKPLQKKKKPRHKKRELYMSLANSSTRKVKPKKMRDQKKKKVKVHYEVSEPDPLPNYTDNPSQKSTSPASSLINNRATVPGRDDETNHQVSRNIEQDNTVDATGPAKGQNGQNLKKDCIIFMRLLNGFVKCCPVDPRQTLDEQLSEMQHVCGPLPPDAYFLHEGKVISSKKSLQEEGVVSGSNMEVQLRLRGGVDPPDAQQELAQELQSRISKLGKHDASKNQAEIRALHIDILNLNDSPQQNALIAALAKKATTGLQEDLQSILENHGLSDTAMQLVLDYVMTKNDLAEKLYKSTKSGNKGDKVYEVLTEKLKRLLETRGALVANEVDPDGSAIWVIEKCPSLAKLHKQSFTTLLELTKAASVADRSVVEDLFTEGCEIRKQCKTYGLSLRTAEKLEKEGIKSASDMTQEQLESVIKHLATDKNKTDKVSHLRKMYSNESSERIDERKIEEKKLEKNRKRVKEAKKLAEEARTMALGAYKDNKEEFENKIKEIVSKLSLPEGWKVQDVKDPNKLLDDLNHEMKIAADNLAITPYVKTEDIAAAASGGLALYGILFNKHDVKSASKRPPFPILKKPEYVEWLSPSLGFQVQFIKSTQSDASTTFYKSAASSGLSIASTASGSGYGVHASASGAYSGQSSTDTSNKRQRTSTHATIIQYISQPTKAFRIPRDEMKLSIEAINKAKEVRDMDSAKRFLKNYGSHVSEGVHTLGGVFLRNLDVKTDKETNESEIMNVAGQQFDAEVSAGYSGAGFSAGGSVKTGTFETSGTNDASAKEARNYFSEMTVKTLGPPTTNPQIFSKVLQSNNATWFIIDRGDREALVPVWSLLSEMEIKDPAKLLEDAWKNKQKVKEKGGAKQSIFAHRHIRLGDT